MRSLALVTTSADIVFIGLNIVKGNEKFYNDFLMPAARLIPPETAHNLAILACKYKVFPSPKKDDSKILTTEFFNRKLKNPVGIAAGFDKQAEAVLGLEQIGFGFIEVGSVTPLPQAGNPLPRVFRLIDDQAVINRYGFNSDGHKVVYNRLEKLKKDEQFKSVIGVNLGKNKTSDNAVADYVQGVNLFGPIADYLVVNISSPNTPGLRDLQGKKELENLLSAVIDARNNLPVNNKVPLLIKLAPDLTKDDIKDICKVVKQSKCRIDGLIISNTTLDKTNLTDKKFCNEDGGVSGVPLRSKSTQLIANVYYETNGKIPIIGVGGITNGRDAYEKIEAGATLVQFYTALIYHGPPILSTIKTELSDILIQKGYTNVSQAVGSNYKKYLSK